MARCVNIDWLEISAEESITFYPCNADFFRAQGYFVNEREYGTKVWGEMFTIEDKEGHPWIEIRRNPPSGSTEFKGLTELSCRIRLCNAQCYVKDCTQRLLEFMVRFNYTYKRIARVDICYDFEYFDYGDQPARFARRYIECVYRKINQAKVRAIGNDNWTMFDWESLSWGSPTSMVSTKMYNKSREIESVSKHKTWIPLAWFHTGLIDNPITRTKHDTNGSEYKPEIWRIEFSLKSKADRWIVIEDQGGKHMKKRAIRHTPDMFDSTDKLWQRFQDLAFHYFRFKVMEYNEQPDENGNRVPIRKDLCADKKLFKFDQDRVFHQLDMAPTGGKPDWQEDALLRKLRLYRETTCDTLARGACDVLIEKLQRNDMRRYTSKEVIREIELLQTELAKRMESTKQQRLEAIAVVQQSLFSDDEFRE